MARKRTNADTNQATAKAAPAKSTMDDDADFDDGDDSEGFEIQEPMSQAERVQTRRRLEDYFEEKRLRQQLGDDFF